MKVIGQTFIAVLFCKQLTQGSNAFVHCDIMFAAFLVRPVRGNTQFSEFVHFSCTDLHFYTAALGIENHSMQGLIAVFFGIGDVIVKFLGYGLPRAMHDAQGGIAVGQIIDYNPHRQQIVQFVDIQLFALHFFPDAVDMLGAAINLGANRFIAKELLQQDNKMIDTRFPLVALGSQGFGNLEICFGFQIAKRHVFQFPFELVYTQTIGNWRINVQGFLSDEVADFIGFFGQDTQTLDPVSQLD